MNYLSNAFSLQMLNTEHPETIRIEPLTIEQVQTVLADGFASAIGHADTARIVGGMICLPVECNRISISLNAADRLIVAQVTGGRLPEGCTRLPEGMEIKFLSVALGE